jgi:hypothetical protein
MNIEKMKEDLFNLIDCEFDLFIEQLNSNGYGKIQIDNEIKSFKIKINSLKSQFVVDIIEKEGLEINTFSNNYNNTPIYYIIELALSSDKRIQENYNSKIISVLYS